MRMVIRSIPVMALAVCLGAAQVSAQQPGNGDFQWYLGPQAGVMVFKTPAQGSSAIPIFGGQTLIVARRTGLLLSVEEAVGSDEQSSYADVNGTQTVTFNDIRKYSAVLMAFPVKAAAQPYLGAGFGLIHVVSPQVGAGAFQSDAAELGSSGFGTFLAGLQFQLGRFMAYGQWQVTTSPSNDTVEDATGTSVAFGRLLDGPTHTFSGGLRIGLGGSRETPKSGGY
jgi:hypothetical protein